MCEVSTRLARNCPGESPGPGRLPQRYADGRLDVTALDSFTWKTILFRFFFTARICGDSVGMLSAMGNSDSTSRIFNILEGTERPLIGSLSLLASTEHTNIHRMSSVC